jgi:hypothetical protein
MSLEMPDNDQHDTEQAPTTAADSETTELPPAKAAEMAHAWSLEETPDHDTSSRRGRFIWAGLVTLVVVVTGALIYLGVTLFGAGQSKHVEKSQEPSASTLVQQCDNCTPEDLEFLRMIHQLDHESFPNVAAASDPVALNIAHNACRLIRERDDPGLANQRVSIDNGWSIEYAYQFVSIAMTAYSDCVGASAYGPTSTSTAP